MINRVQPQVVSRFFGEMFGVCSDREPASRAMKLGSYLAGFGYVMVLGGLILLFLATSFSDWSESARFRIASTIGVVALVSLPKVVQLMPRVLRLGMIGAWGLVALFADDVRRISTDASRHSDGVTDIACGVIQDRTPPTELYVDSFAFAIHNDLAQMSADSYLDLLYTGFVTYSAHNLSTPRNLITALGALGLEGPAYARFARNLTRYRIHEENGRGVLDIWFCGFDLEWDTCDDRRGSYPWSNNLAEAIANTPQLRGDTVGRRSEVAPTER